MSWLRNDDTYDTHPKIVGLKTDARRWTWHRVLLYTTRHRTAVIPTSVHDVIAKATPAFLRDCVDLGLIDIDEDGLMVVHDWDHYQAGDRRKQNAAAERMRRQREEQPRVAGGRWQQTRAAVFARDRGVCVDCGKDCSQADGSDGRDVWNADHEPPRKSLEELGLSIYDPRFIVTRCHSCHAKKTRRQTGRPSEPASEPQSEPWQVVRTSHARAGARPSRPVPESQEPSVAVTASIERRAPDEAEPVNGDGDGAGVDIDIDFNSILKEV